MKKGQASSAPREEHDHPIEPVPSGLIRWRFLVVLDTGVCGADRGERQGVD
jgi:hypothetical protein